MADRARRSAFVAFTVDFTALVEEVLHPGALGVLGDEIELVPEPVESPSVAFSSRISSRSAVSSR